MTAKLPGRWVLFGGFLGPTDLLKIVGRLLGRELFFSRESDADLSNMLIHSPGKLPMPSTVTVLRICIVRPAWESLDSIFSGARNSWV
jgi:hypothetical protein